MGEVTESVNHPWTYTFVRDRHTQVLLARLRIGHTRLTNSYLMSRDPQPYCDDCIVPLTVRHILAECPSLLDLRHRYLYRCRGRGGGEFHLFQILGSNSLAPGYDVLSFLGEAGLLPRL